MSSRRARKAVEARTIETCEVIEEHLLRLGATDALKMTLAASDGGCGCDDCVSVAVDDALARASMD